MRGMCRFVNELGTIQIKFLGKNQTLNCFSQVDLSVSIGGRGIEDLRSQNHCKSFAESKYF